MWRSFRFISLVVVAFAATGAGAARYARDTVAVDVPAMVLVDQHGARVALRDVLARPGPLLVQFVFTSCGTICPVLTQTAAATQRAVRGLEVVSISIDPDEDTPARLAAYAQRHGVGDGWHFLTGSPDDSIAAQRAFGAYAGNKMRHLPLSFLRAAPGHDWLRVEGAFTPADLAAEFRALAPGDATLGRRLYRDGVLASGRPLTAQGAGGVVLDGPAAACANCHRRSGYGGIEGRAYVPPVTGPWLFAIREPRRVDQFRALFQEELAPDALARLRAATARPAYTDATFAQALAHGRASDGRAFDALMPRYALPDADRANLAAYLATLGDTSSGVDDEQIHFATIVAGRVPPARREAMLAVMHAWLAQRNADTARRAARPPNPMGYEDDLPLANRHWTLDVWTLDGDPRGWPAQLDAWQRRQPVFAVIGGLGDWRAVHAFCEAQRMPCVLSLADAPVREDGDYTLYLSGGLPLEARTLARHLVEAWPSLDARQIVQMTGDADGEAAAATLREALAGTAVPVLSAAVPGEAAAGEVAAREVAAREAAALSGRALALPAGVALGEAAASVVSGDARAFVALGEAEESVDSGGAAGSVASGDDEMSVASGGAAAFVASGEAAMSVVSGEGAAFVASGEGAMSVASGGAAASVASGEGAMSVASGGAAASVASGEGEMFVASGGAAASVASSEGDRSFASREAAASVASGEAAASVAVLWLDGDALRRSADTLEKAAYRRIYVSRARAGDAVATWSPALRAKTVLIDRYALPDEPLPHAYRARAWLRSHGAAGDEEAVRLSTYYLMSVTESAVAQLLDHYSRELLIEAIEREAESVPNPGPYPSLSLGPGQRVAAKRCRVPETGSGSLPAPVK